MINIALSNLKPAYKIKLWAGSNRSQYVLAVDMAQSCRVIDLANKINTTKGSTDQ